MLTTEAIQAAAPGSKQYKLHDSQGLILLVTPNGKKWWRIRYRLDNKEQQLSLGGFPAVSLDEARLLRNEIRNQLAQGLDPSQQRRIAAAAQRQKQAMQAKRSRFLLDSNGSLQLRIGKAVIDLTPTETNDLRHFLDATRNVSMKEEQHGLD